MAWSTRVINTPKAFETASRPCLLDLYSRRELFFFLRTGSGGGETTAPASSTSLVAWRVSLVAMASSPASKGVEGGGEGAGAWVLTTTRRVGEGGGATGGDGEGGGEGEKDGVGGAVAGAGTSWSSS